MGKEVLKVKVDTTSFNKTFGRYMELTSKTLADAINQKLFDACRFALRATGKASASTVRASLNTKTFRYPRLTVAEAMVLKGKPHFTQITDAELKQEAKTFINKKVQTIAFAKSGWIPALKEMMPFIFKDKLTVSGVNATGKKGGASPIKRPSNVMKGEVFNDVKGTRNLPRVEGIKNQGAQDAINKVEADMVSYIEKKLAPHNAEFNK